MTYLLLLGILLFTFIGASDAVFLLCRRFLGDRAPDDLALYWLTRGAGPVMISLLSYLAFLFFPGRPEASYLGFVVAFVVVLAGVGRRSWPRLGAIYKRLWRSSGTSASGETSRAPLVVALVLALASLVFGIAYPIVEHDSLSAVIEARIMARDLGMTHYLELEPDPETGFYMENFRTPFLQMLCVFFSLAGGASHMDLLARTVSPIYGLYCLALVGLVAWRRWSWHAATWAVFLLAATPLFFYMSYNNGLDPARLFLAFAALVFYAELIRQPEGSFGLVLVTGLFSGLALYSHLLAVPALAGGGLAFLAARRWPVGRKAVAVLILGVVTLGVGAQFHYLTSPVVANRLSRSFSLEFLQEVARLGRAADETEDADAVQEPAVAKALAIEEPPSAAAEPLPPLDTEPPPAAEPLQVDKPTPEVTKPLPSPSAEPPPIEEREKSRTAIDRFGALLEIRGQGRSALSQFIFGRLQMFTGIEYFGFLFFLFWAAAGFWLLKESSKSTLDTVLLTATLLITVIVLSGVRKLSWSNPRYIGSALLIAAYFAAPLMVMIECRLRRALPRRRGLVTMALVLVLSFPVVLVTSIRGAKVEISNPGSFYADFRSFEWVGYTLEHPAAALDAFWERYFGIRKTIRYFLADETTQLRHAHDYFAATLYVNEHLPEDARLFVFRDARFFYYGERYAVVWYSPENDLHSYYEAGNADEMFAHLVAKGYTHVLADDYSAKKRGYVDTVIGEVLENPRYAEPIFEYGIARIYRLRTERLESP